MEELVEQLRGDVLMLRNDVAMLAYDVTQLRKQLDDIQGMLHQSYNSVGIAPNTPPPDWLPPDEI